MAHFLEKFLTGDKFTNSRTKYEVLFTGILLITAQAAIQTHTAPKVYQYSAYFSKLDDKISVLSQNPLESNLTCSPSSENANYSESRKLTRSDWSLPRPRRQCSGLETNFENLYFLPKNFPN